MAPRIVLLGATGYTGRLIAERLVAAGAGPVLAGRSAESLQSLATELGGGGCETAVVSLDQPGGVAALLDPGDVLLTTVGSFLKRGDVALRAALERRAHYLDTTGEAPFIRRVFELAAGASSAFVPAMGYNYAPGNLAGALVLERAGDAAHALDIGYFLTGEGQGALSGGTLASATGVLMARGFTWRAGALVEERVGARTRSYDIQGRWLPAMTLGSSECLTLPQLYPRIDSVDVYQGGLGAATPVVAQVSRLAAVPFLARAANAISAAAFKGSTGGPDAATRASAGTYVVATAFNRAGHTLGQVVLRGPDVYTVTADLCAWAAQRAAAGELHGAGPMGPVQAFGLRELERGCASLAIRAELEPA